ncbi:uncharacterized protein MYCFIDRAFT_212092 [Pseudocercospora fijiensis CIRAD86]|uniref:Uncharacterized protein n=1 Tax=Pseudocercospora fijiensis (strain CIRAD86) TaxID=383855 RepID=M2YSE7_PSEFD|nr:uncharacterized protein MYCFIDRAFT_212092 [Pseudocercospora fijiensis CIRAD86]EME80645.1 hypothetical protein MYCFIDRAFT_212092 [Pseudocercospora fijiensis CIRAD86]
MAPLHLHSTLSRSFHTTSPSRASPSILFALNALSNSRETQHFNKLSRLDRVEHSPTLKLIQTSEIEKHPCPTPEVVPVPAPWRSINVHVDAASQNRRSHVWDTKALAAGRAVLADVARERARMRRVLERMRRREEGRSRVLRTEMDAIVEERRRMRNEMRVAGVWILGSVGVATGLGMYVFWPAGEKVLAKDSAEMGRKIAEMAKTGISLPAAVSEPVAAVGAVPTMAVVTGEPTIAATTVIKEEVKKPARSWSWKSLFWKQG